MKMIKNIITAAVLFALAGAAQAITIDFKSLADGSLGESAWNTLSFKADGSHTTSISDAFVDITGTNGDNSYAYLDSNNAGLGVCGELYDSASANQAFSNSGTNLCNPGSDDNVTNHGGTPETLHFIFDAEVVIENIWLNNNHDGDKSLLNDFILLGIDGSTASTQLTNGGYKVDSVLNLGLTLGAGKSLDIGFDNSQSCGGNFNNCEFYISKIEFSTVPEPAALTLIGLGLIGIGAARRFNKQ